MEERKTNFLGEIHEKQFEVYALHGWVEEAKEAARLATERYAVVLGRRMASELDWATFAEEPERWKRWEELSTS